ncbi:hypothetical protein A11S_860 [Micavibrio aeruginosavorus EPB]|uniref:Uncharacterized protein n=1 Tax=Micavibrio aeruginosavorus EPB TaxID=349215 RepID=M4VEM5_9BACT|nr:hypothetical protein A11S_860 [Micavibrio aeruginosavorus EPB]
MTDTPPITERFLSPGPAKQQIRSHITIVWVGINSIVGCGVEVLYQQGFFDPRIKISKNYRYRTVGYARVWANC